MSNIEDSDDEARDLDLAALLRAAGSRDEPTPVAATAVRTAVEAEWRATVAARRRRRRSVWFSAAAGIAVATVGLWIARPLYRPAAGPVAALLRVDGPAEWRARDASAWQPLVAGTELHEGDEVRTDAGGRAALRLASGVGVRLDADSRVAFADPRHASLALGGVYVDSGRDGTDPSRALELDTPLGAVRHLGTQYEARMVGDALQVAVREGTVAVEFAGRDVVGSAGERLRLEAGRVERSALSPNDPAWAWVGAVTPPFAIEGRSLDDFLAWAARETGRQLVYASPEVAKRARSIVLEGSIAGLTPDQALDAVMATTALRPEVGTARIRVEPARVPATEDSRP